MSDPNIPPALLIGPEAVRTLHASGYRIVPEKPTKQMIRAAVLQLDKIKAETGLSWLDYDASKKAKVRWDAMLSAWKVDRAGLSPSAAQRWQVEQAKRDTVGSLLRRIGSKLTSPGMVKVNLWHRAAKQRGWM